MDYKYNVLANNIQKFRKRASLTQADLSGKLDVSFQTVAKWENAKCLPDTLMLPKLADVFECFIDDLFSRMPYAGRKEIHSMFSADTFENSDCTIDKDFAKQQMQKRKIIKIFDIKIFYFTNKITLSIVIVNEGGSLWIIEN